MEMCYALEGQVLENNVLSRTVNCSVTFNQDEMIADFKYRVCQHDRKSPKANWVIFIVTILMPVLRFGLGST